MEFRDIVRSFGGELMVESTLGRGSIFRVRLPAAAYEEREEAPVRVLLIDDEAKIGDAFARMLEPDHEVVACTTTDDAVDRDGLTAEEDGLEGEACVCDLTEPLGLSQPTVSHHLGLLRMSNLISNRRDGKQVFYDLNGHVEAGEGATMLEPQLFVLAPGATSDGAYAHDGEEFLYVLDGAVTLWVGAEQRYRLTAGDALTFPSTLPHRWRNRREYADGGVSDGQGEIRHSLHGRCRSSWPANIRVHVRHI